MFETIIVRPIFNVLVLVLSVIPGHNLGLAIIIFTLLVRLLLWPLLKKQLHHTKAMRDLQPELKRIKKESKGDRQKEAAMTMALYKEKEINPFSSLGIVLLQLPILIGLYIGLRRVITDPHNLIKFAYEPLRNLSYMKDLKVNIGRFDATLFHVVDLKRAASGKEGWYLPALLIAAGSSVIQYFQSKQLTPDNGDSRGVRQILKDSAKGKQADQAEMNAAVSRVTLLMIPGLILLIALGLSSALPLYWLASGLIAYVQQSHILGQDQEELVAVADAVPTDAKVVKATVAKPKKKKTRK